MDESTDIKTCSTCGESKPASAFPRRSQCRTCLAARMRKYRQEHPEKIKAIEARRHARHGDARRAAQQSYYARNREVILAKAAQRYADNPEPAIAYARQWGAANPEKMAAYYKTYRQRNPDKVRVSNQNRRTRLGGKTVSRAELESIWTGSCAICQCILDRTLQFPNPLSRSIDHIVPLAAGGEHVISNLQWTCLGCNMRKSDRQT